MTDTHRVLEEVSAERDELRYLLEEVRRSNQVLVRTQQDQSGALNPTVTVTPEELERVRSQAEAISLMEARTAEENKDLHARLQQLEQQLERLRLETSHAKRGVNPGGSDCLTRMAGGGARGVVMEPPSRMDKEFSRTNLARNAGYTTQV